MMKVFGTKSGEKRRYQTISYPLLSGKAAFILLILTESFPMTGGIEVTSVLDTMLLFA